MGKRGLFERAVRARTWKRVHVSVRNGALERKTPKYRIPAVSEEEKDQKRGHGSSHEMLLTLAGLAGLGSGKAGFQLPGV